MATANPALNDDIFLANPRSLSGAATDRMTVSGTVLKTSMLLVVLLTTAAFTWTQAKHGETGTLYALMIGGMIGGLVSAFATIWFPKVSAFTAPVYAACEGFVLGAISVIMEAKYPGIAVQAAMLSTATLAAMLGLYASGLVRATARFRTGVLAATGAVALVYLASMVMRLFGAEMPYIHESSLMGIGFSVVVVVIAALNLILDFDSIETGVRMQAPKYMEWYAGFGLLVTLVWMYLEILRLLAKLRGRD